MALTVSNRCVEDAQAETGKETSAEERVQILSQGRREAINIGGGGVVMF